ncbi:MAG: glycosyltransferase [Planctomycetaceae bacterium]
MYVLVISQQFPPATSPRAIRWGAVAAAWANAGDRVDVICAAHGSPGRLPKSDRLRVYPVGGRTVDRWRSRLLWQARLRDAGPPQPDCARTASWRRDTLRQCARSARWLKNHTWKHLHWPDSACLWALAARRQASRLIARNRYDGLITVSNPYSCHLVGLHVRRHDSQLPWLVDLGDPFSELTSEPANNLRLYSAANRRLECRVLSHADRVSVTTQGTASSYLQQFPQVAGKVQVIPPVLSLPDCNPGPHPAACPVGDQQPRRLVYAGSLYRSIRNPRAVLQLFSRLIARPETRDLELHFYGRVDDCREEFRSYHDLLGRKVVIHGPVDRATVWQQMHAAHALVNLGNATTTQLPSKIIEYAATGRPILNVVQHQRDTSQAWFEGYRSVFHVEPRQTLESEPRLAALTAFLNTAATADPQEIRSFLAPYQVDNIAQAYRRLMTDACQRARAA